MANKLKLEFHNARYTDDDLRDSISKILEINELCAIATLREGTSSHIHTAFFSYDENLDLYFISPTTDRHSINIRMNPSVAVAVWNKTDRWSEDLQGIQMFGRAEVLNPGLEMVRGMTCFLGRFRDFSSIITRPGEFAKGIASRIYVIRLNSLKLIDEPRFGRRNYIVLDIQKE
jgi:uncharacterized protein YhbP (UPF0306 family)